MEINVSEMVTWIKWNKWRGILKLNYSENKFSEFPDWSQIHDLPGYQ